MDVKMEIAKLEDEERAILERAMSTWPRLSAVDELKLSRVRIKLEKLRSRPKNYDRKDFGISEKK